MLTLRVIATRVIALMTEPLLTARQALLIEGCLDDAVRARPVWMGAWISGLLAGTLSTLPPDDPWRHIHARYEGRDFGDLSVDLTAPVTSECAISPRGRFASPEDQSSRSIPRTALPTSRSPGPRSNSPRVRPPCSPVPWTAGAQPSRRGSRLPSH